MNSLLLVKSYVYLHTSPAQIISQFKHMQQQKATALSS